MNNTRTQYSNHTNATKFDENEKKINLQYGLDGEIAFIKLLNEKFGSIYKWFCYKNKYQAVDFYGIKHSEINEDTTYTYQELELKAEIMIELKSKRNLVNKHTQKVSRALVSKGSKNREIYHYCNWSKFVYIKNNLVKGNIKRAFIVFDYMKKHITNSLCSYDVKNSGDYYFHEITLDKLKFDDELGKKSPYRDYSKGFHYIEGYGQNSNRDVEDKLIRIPYNKVLPMRFFKSTLLYTQKNRSIERLLNSINDCVELEDILWDDTNCISNKYSQQQFRAKYSTKTFDLTMEEFIDLKLPKQYRELYEDSKNWIFL